MESINDRIQIIVDQFYKGNVSAFCRDIGLPQSTFKDILGTRKSKPSSDTLAGMISATSIKINPTWLLIGKGEKLLSESVDNEVYQRRINELERICELQQKLINEYEIQLGKKQKSNCA